MLSLKIALRYFLTKKSHNAVNIISIVSMIGVAVATAAIVCVLSVFNGFSDLSESQQSAVSPHLRVLPTKGKTIEAGDSLLSLIASCPQVKATAGRISEKALAIYHHRQMPVQIIAFTDGAKEVVNYQPLLIEGELLDYAPQDSSIHCASLTIGVAARLGIAPGYYDWLALYTPRRQGRISMANAINAFITDSLIVSGVFETKDINFDMSTVLVPIDVARHLFDYPTQLSSIDISLHPDVDPRQAADELSSLLDGNFSILTRLQQNESSYRMIEIEKWITFLMLALILLIASFNVISTISMLIIEKEDNIFTLKAMGMTNRMVRRIYIIEGWLITMVGSIIGVIIGIALSLTQQYGQIIKLNADPEALNIIAYPVRLQISDIAIILTLTAIVGWLVGTTASLFISRK